MKLYTQYLETMRKQADVEHAIAVLSWDKEVNLPSKANQFRGQQIATLSGISHEIITDESFGTLLKKLANGKEKLKRKEAKNIALKLKNFERNNKLSSEFVMRRSKIISETYFAWIKAREANDYRLYKKPLEKMIEVKLEEAELIGYEDHPYDALMEEFEPGARVKQLDVLFKDVREQLVDFVKSLKNKTQVDDGFLYQQYDKDKQWQFGLDLLENMGYDFEAGRQDISAHPFTISFGATDVRVTTRVDEMNFSNMTWSCIHEGGHALYEQGLPASAYGLPVGKYVSLGIHESQSRLWENNVGRSLVYWKAHFKKLKKLFPENLKGVGVKQFYKAINKVTPSLIRTESDELHYHFHVLIRYEIEKGLLDGTFKAKDLKEIWNSKYKEYLGLEVPDDKSGILQDIHWSHGSLGYFATYSLGSFYAAQFFHQATKDIPDLASQIQKGDNTNLLAWLRKNIHQHGQYYTAAQLCKRITGEELNFKYFMTYARKKYARI